MSTTAKQAGKDDDFAKKSDVEDLRNEMNERFDQVNDRLDDHSERMGRVEDLLVEINRKM